MKRSNSSSGIDLYCREVLSSSPEIFETKTKVFKLQKLSELYPRFKNTIKDEYIYFSYPDVKDNINNIYKK